MQRGIGKQCPQPPHQRQGETSTAVGDNPHPRRRLVRPRHIGKLHPQRGHARENGNAEAVRGTDDIPGDQIIQRDSTCPNSPGRKIADFARSRNSAAARKACDQCRTGVDNAQPISLRATDWHGSKPRLSGGQSILKYREVDTTSEGSAVDGGMTSSCSPSPPSSITAQSRGTSPGLETGAALLSANEEHRTAIRKDMCDLPGLSTGLIGTWIKPARAAASGIRQAMRVLRSHVATRAPRGSPLAARAAAIDPTAVSSSAKLTRRPDPTARAHQRHHGPANDPEGTAYRPGLAPSRAALPHRLDERKHLGLGTMAIDVSVFTNLDDVARDAGGALDRAQQPRLFRSARLASPDRRAQPSAWRSACRPRTRWRGDGLAVPVTLRAASEPARELVYARRRSRHSPRNRSTAHRGAGALSS